MPRLRRYLWALPVILLAVLVAQFMQPYFDRTNVVMVYMLAVVAVAFRLGGGPAAMACLLSVFLFDFINVPPYFSFGSDAYEYLVTLGAMLVTVGIISTLAGNLRQKARESADREARTAALYALSADLAGQPSEQAIVAAAVAHVARAFGAEVEVFRLQVWPQGGDAPERPASDADGPFLAQEGDRVRAWVPLAVEAGLQAGLRVTAPAAQLATREQREHLAAMARQCVQALERNQLRERVREKELLIQKEALRNSLLNAVSHDLRTPLATIIGASSSLQAEGDSFSPEARHRLRGLIVEEARHMQHMVENLLDMARFQGGDIVLARDWQALEEIAGAAVAAIRRRMRGHEVRVQVPHDLPFLRCDSVLVERVVVNLLENACKYSPPGSVVTLSARVVEGAVEVAVADTGPGIPPAQREQVFDPFVRLHGGAAGGLGLTICRSIVEAHGGRIWIDSAEGGGAVVRFTLPLAEGGPAAVGDNVVEGEEA